MGDHVHVSAVLGSSQLRDWADEAGADVAWAGAGAPSGGTALGPSAEPCVLQVGRPVLSWVVPLALCVVLGMVWAGAGGTCILDVGLHRRP